MPGLDCSALFREMAPKLSHMGINYSKQNEKIQKPHVNKHPGNKYRFQNEISFGTHQMTGLIDHKFQTSLCFWRLLFNFHFPGFKSEPAWSVSEAPKGFKGVSPDQQSAARWTKRQIIKPMRGSARSNSRQTVTGASNRRGYVPVEEPRGGWAATTPNSECGRHLIDLYRVGRFTVDDQPSYI